MAGTERQIKYALTAVQKSHSGKDANIRRKNQPNILENWKPVQIGTRIGTNSVQLMKIYFKETSCWCVGRVENRQMQRRVARVNIERVDWRPRPRVGTVPRHRSAAQTPPDNRRRWTRRSRRPREEGYDSLSLWVRPSCVRHPVRTRAPTNRRTCAISASLDISRHCRIVARRRRRRRLVNVRQGVGNVRTAKFVGCVVVEYLPERGAGMALEKCGRSQWTQVFQQVDTAPIRAHVCIAQQWPRRW